MINIKCSVRKTLYKTGGSIAKQLILEPLFLQLKVMKIKVCLIRSTFWSTRQAKFRFPLKS